MIANITGKILDITAQSIVVDVNGVGYEVFCTGRCRDSRLVDEQIALVVHTEVREDSIRLFGFDDKLEKQVFLLLLKVRGLGAKTALDVLTQIEKRDLLRIIGSGDLDQLQLVRGIGKKTAERIIVELKDKVGEHVRDAMSNNVASEPRNDALQALLSLGFSKRDAEFAIDKAVSQIARNFDDAGDIVKEALKYV